MVDGRQREEWNHTAQLLAMLYNAFRGKGQRALGPADFHPLIEKRTPNITLKELSNLGALQSAKD